MPNSLTTIHSIASVFSTSPPESVWGTGGSNLARNFSWQHRITLLPAYAVTVKPRTTRGGFTTPRSCALRRGQPSPRGGYLPASFHRLPTTVSGHTPSTPRHTRPRRAGRAVDGAPGVLSINGIGMGRSYAGSGISTGCPSTTPVGLALGPDLPRAD